MIHDRPLKDKKRGLVCSWWKENALVVAFLNKPLEVGGCGGVGGGDNSASVFADTKDYRM